MWQQIRSSLPYTATHCNTLPYVARDQKFMWQQIRRNKKETCGNTSQVVISRGGKWGARKGKGGEQRGNMWQKMGSCDVWRKDGGNMGARREEIINEQENTKCSRVNRKLRRECVIIRWQWENEVQGKIIKENKKRKQVGNEARVTHQEGFFVFWVEICHQYVRSCSHEFPYSMKREVKKGKKRGGKKTRWCASAFCLSNLFLEQLLRCP